MILAIDYQDLLLKCARYFRNGGTTDAIQVLKLQEETGEVAEAYIGMLGLNPRKGQTHSGHDVAMECADVAMTALLTIVMLGFSPDQILSEQTEKVEQLLAAGSVNSPQGSVRNEHG